MIRALLFLWAWRRAGSRSVWIVLMLPLCACQGLYFHTLPPAEPLHLRLPELPKTEYWTGIVFNGEKIGFTHFALVPEHEHWRINATAVMHFQLLGYSKKLTLKSTDLVDKDLQLLEFKYDYEIDGSRLEITGRRTREGLETLSRQAGIDSPVLLPVNGPLWPSSAIALLPVTRGIDQDGSFEYQVYDGETQSIVSVRQDVVGYERSDLFDGSAWHLRTQMHGHSADTWINSLGLPELELSLNGVIIAHLEDEVRARDYLLQASMSKNENLLDFSLVRSARPLTEVHKLDSIELELSDLPANFAPQTGSGQQCQELVLGRWTCRIDADLVDPNDRYRPAHLAPSQAVPSASAVIKKQLELIGASKAGANSPERLLAWVHENIAAVAEDSFSALDVLSNRRGECQGQSNLLASLLRANGTPTRIVNGLVYSEPLQGFAWHTWVEVWQNGRWQGMDPVFGQSRVDATHVRLLEGELPADLVPLLGLIGQIKVDVLSAESESGGTALEF